VRRITFCGNNLTYLPRLAETPKRRQPDQGDCHEGQVCTVFEQGPLALDGRPVAVAVRHRLGVRRAGLAQRKACTPDVYRLCPGEIPNVRAITACLRRQKASLSEACRAAFEP